MSSQKRFASRASICEVSQDATKRMLSLVTLNMFQQNPLLRLASVHWNSVLARCRIKVGSNSQIWPVVSRHWLQNGRARFLAIL